MYIIRLEFAYNQWVVWAPYPDVVWRNSDVDSGQVGHHIRQLFCQPRSQTTASTPFVVNAIEVTNIYFPGMNTYAYCAI